MEDQERGQLETEQLDENEEVINIEVRDAIVEVRKTIFGKEEVSQDRIRIRPFISTPATISVKAGFTKNLGNYESARVDVFLSMPCYPGEVDEVYEQVKDWVDGRVEKEWLSIEDSKKKK